MEALLLDENDMAKLFNVQPSTIRTWKRRKQIPQEVIFKLPGTEKGTVRFIKSKVEDWVNGKLQKGI